MKTVHEIEGDSHDHNQDEGEGTFHALFLSPDRPVCNLAGQREGTICLAMGVRNKWVRVASRFRERYRSANASLRAMSEILYN